MRHNKCFPVGQIVLPGNTYAEDHGIDDMSRGPGRIERAIFDLFEEHPEGAWTTADLCRLIYPTANRVEKKHRVAVLRAMDKVIDKKGDQHRDWGWFYFGLKGAAARVLASTLGRRARGKGACLGRDSGGRGA